MEERNDEAAEEAEAQQPPWKKLKSSDPDLKVILNFVDVYGQAQEREYDMYGQTLAKMSRFVDACLAADMKEKATNRIVLDDVRPEIFEKGIRYLEKPVASRSMTTQDALELIAFYDKYEFSDGIDLCDAVFCGYFSDENRPDDDFVAIDLSIDVAITADKYNLLNSKDAGVDVIESTLYVYDEEKVLSYYTLDRFKKLHPLFQKGRIDHRIEGLTSEELNSPLFPKFWLERKSHEVALDAAKVLYLTGTRTNADGDYLRQDDEFVAPKGTGDRQYGSFQLVVAKSDPAGPEAGDWIIFGRADDNNYTDNLWHTPGSKNFSVPPTKGWKPIHITVKRRKKVEIKYGSPA